MNINVNNQLCLTLTPSMVRWHKWCDAGGSRIVMCTRIILTNRVVIKYYDTVWIAFCTKLFKMPTFYSLVVCWLWCWCRWSLVESLKLISHDLEAEAWQCWKSKKKWFFSSGTAGLKRFIAPKPHFGHWTVIKNLFGKGYVYKHRSWRNKTYNFRKGPFFLGHSV